MNQDFWNIWLKSPTILTENVENQMKIFKEFQPQNQVQVSAVNDYVKDQMDLAGKLQKDLTNTRHSESVLLIDKILLFY